MAVGPPKVSYLFYGADQVGLSRSSGGQGTIVVGPGGDSSVEKSSIKTEDMLRPAFSLDDYNLGAAEASSRQRLFCSLTETPAILFLISVCGVNGSLV